MPRWKFLLSQLGDKLWVRAALYAVFGISVALLAGLLDFWVPDALAKPFGGGTVNALLNVLATSLLTVATFSVAAMLTAFTNVSQSATPRAARLIAGNRQAQGALSTFVGAFLYAVVAYSALGTGYYGTGGRAIVFFITLIMLALVAVTLLRWLDQLLRLARVDNVIGAVEAETADAMNGPFGARSANPGPNPPPFGAALVTANEVGYVQNVDLPAIRKLAAEASLHVWINARPGTFTVPTTTLAAVNGRRTEEVMARLRKAFTLGAERSFSQDPQFGFIVLNEIASHALSAAMNNHGVAKDVIASVARLLIRWMDLRRQSPPPADDGVYWTDIGLQEVVEDALLPISIDGATTLTVAIRLQNVLAAMGQSAPGGAGEGAAGADRDVLARFAREALERSERGLDHAPDRVRIRAAAGLLAEP